MKICYLLESTNLCGGVRVVFDQAVGLTNRGHSVFIRALTGDHSWYHNPVKVEYIPDLATPFSEEDFPDVIIGTFWTTIKSAVSLGCPKTFHLCQGYEGLNPEYSSLKDRIEEAYRLPIPKITVGEWLSEFLTNQFGKGCFKIFCVGQIVDVDLYRPRHPLKRVISLLWHKNPPEILVSGLFNASVKAIPDALQAVSILRRKGRKVLLTRVTTEDTYDNEEKITRIDRYYLNIPPKDLLEIYRNSTIYIAPSLQAEGFGLPFAEALACGIPSIATTIPSHMSFDSRRNYAVFVPEGRPDAIARGIEQILDNPFLRLRLSLRGPRLIRNLFSREKVSQRLEEIFFNA